MDTLSTKKAAILKAIVEADVKFIRLQFSDIFGQLKNTTITRGMLEKALNNECMFDGSSIEGFVRIEESDMFLYPDLDSFRIFPFQTGEQYYSARLICDAYTSAKKPFEGDPRYILKKVLSEASDMGYTVNAGPEVEFFLFDKDADGNASLNSRDKGGYLDMSPVGLGGDCRRDICVALEQMGFEIETSHHECAPAQHEIDFKYADALKAADNIMTFKMVVKSVANRHGLHATFMPKPKYGVAGSGMHLNLSLNDKKTNKNAFYDSTDPLSLSKLAYGFIAGMVQEAPHFTAVTNPLVNSYKRLVSGFEAPVYVAWSASNRSSLIRVPFAKGEATRVELRSPDPSCNPYLAIAMAVAAGLEGIKKGLKPPKSIDKNIYDMTDAERKAAKIVSLPSDLGCAVEQLEQSPFAKSVLGDHIFTKYIEAKKHEWNDYRSRVSCWEIENYLSKY